MEQLERVLGYEFKDKTILRTALTHKSYASETAGAHDNERLEFLGDSVLGLSTAHFLYFKKPSSEEGKLSKSKSILVSRKFMHQWACEINLGNYLLLGEGERRSEGRTKDSILSNAMEAVLGAVYLDGGFDAANKIIAAWLNENYPKSNVVDYKSTLQERVQKKYKISPVYKTRLVVGPEHDKTFTVEVVVKNKILGSGLGKTKKAAEQESAKNALENIDSKKINL